MTNLLRARHRVGSRRRASLVVGALVTVFGALVVLPAHAAGPSTLPGTSARSPARVESTVSGPKVLADCVHEVRRPTGIILACADANAYLKGLSWRTWGGAVARGRGVYWANDCVPDCAAGHFHRHLAYVHLSRVRLGLYSRATLFLSLRGHPHHIEVFDLATRPVG
ncbi:MAG TPA: hypothetical protein VMI11_15290 [Actinomycetes bacterium]|nr:hypothetical protein [Actinomycetes bacterium]